jgi:hypothetical protein
MPEPAPTTPAPQGVVRAPGEPDVPAAEPVTASAPEELPLPPIEPEVALVGALFAGAAIFFGIFPSPLFDFAAHAGQALSGLL